MNKPKASGQTAPAALRWAIGFLSTVLIFLWIWLLGFVLSDIGDLEGPDYQEIESRHVEASLKERMEALSDQIQELDVQTRRQEEIQKTLKQSMDNAKSTMDQMMDLHRLGLERDVNPSATQQEALASAQQRFLDAQNRFEQANAEITTSNQRKFELSQEQNTLNSQLEKQREPATKEYQELLRKHRFKVASFKLSFIVPLFLLSAWLVYRKRSSIFLPILLSTLVATFWKVGTVMFEHFPKEFFKDIAIIAIIVIVIAFLISLLRKAVRPGAVTLMKRYREAYASHHCPICSYPIARGSLKQAVWTRKGPRTVLPPSQKPQDEESPYACPSCGTSLFESCDECQSQRHSLLPYCDHCGHEKDVPQLSAAS